MLSIIFQNNSTNLNDFVSGLNTATLMSRWLEDNLCDGVDAGGRAVVEDDAEVVFLRPAFSRGNVEAGRLEDNGIVDVANESVGQICQFLATTPLKRENMFHLNYILND